MPDLPDVVLWSIPAFLVLLAAEAVSYRLHPDDDELGFERKDTLTSLAMGLGSLGWDLLWAVPIAVVNAGVFGWLYLAASWEIPVTWPWTLAAVVVYDFFYYWSHRGHHVIRLLWASHVVHHSSRRFNLSTALRQPWTGFTGWIFYVPMGVAGFHPAVVAFVGGVNLVYQFWIHTERIGRLHPWFEFLFNTPSHHRVHHASQGSYLDRNFGGILIVWDRAFGSFAPETERPVYGLTKNIETHNPVMVAFHEYLSIGRDVVRSRDWRERLGRVFRSPGWQPSRPVLPEEVSR
ncbi:sterol desaturase family protein [Planomonospora corallina]|uniref:Sterol desaturase family protein n=1 Tax=Planomonospora corallina TaxID=1806052 RepID=A0ABV8I362_9ACTN